MKFACERCGKRFASVDEPAPGRVYKIRCRCGNVIHISSPHADPDAARRTGALPPLDRPRITGATPAVGGAAPPAHAAHGVTGEATSRVSLAPPASARAPGPAAAPRRTVTTAGPPTPAEAHPLATPFPELEPPRIEAPPPPFELPDLNLPLPPRNGPAPGTRTGSFVPPAAKGPEIPRPSRMMAPPPVEPLPRMPPLAAPPPPTYTRPGVPAAAPDDPFAVAAAHARASHLELPAQMAQHGAAPSVPPGTADASLHGSEPAPQVGLGRKLPLTAIAVVVVVLALAAVAGTVVWKMRKGGEPVAAAPAAPVAAPAVPPAAPAPVPPPVAPQVAAPAPAPPVAAAAPPPTAPSPAAAPQQPPAPPPVASAAAEPPPRIDKQPARRAAEDDRRDRDERRAREREAKEQREREAREAREARAREERDAKERERNAREEREARAREEREAKEREAKERDRLAREAREARAREEREAKERDRLAREQRAREERQMDEMERIAREQRARDEREARERAVASAAPAPAAKKAETDGLDPAVMQSIIARSRPAMDACVSAALQDPATASYAGRKAALLILVSSDGKAEAALEDGDLDASNFGNCLRRATGKMSFPKFKGEDVGARIVLQLGR